MGIYKDITRHDGQIATYWHIGVYNEFFKNNKGQVILYGFASKAARDADEAPLIASNIDIHVIAPTEENPSPAGSYVPDMTRQELYESVKTKPEFSGATDDI